MHIFYANFHHHARRRRREQEKCTHGVVDMAKWIQQDETQHTHTHKHHTKETEEELTRTDDNCCSDDDNDDVEETFLGWIILCDRHISRVKMVLALHGCCLWWCCCCFYCCLCAGLVVRLVWLCHGTVLLAAVRLTTIGVGATKPLSERQNGSHFEKSIHFEIVSLSSGSSARSLTLGFL